MRRTVTLAAIATAICISAAASAQNVLVNGDFEANPPQSFGNNIGWSISPWVLGTGNNSLGGQSKPAINRHLKTGH